MRQYILKYVKDACSKYRHTSAYLEFQKDYALLQSQIVFGDQPAENKFAACNIGDLLRVLAQICTGLYSVLTKFQNHILITKIQRKSSIR